MIIEQNGQALELAEGSFRIYATQEEFTWLAGQAIEAAKKVKIGWVDINPKDKEHKVSTKPQNPTIKPWIS